MLGLVEQFTCAAETREQLVHAISILLVEHKRVTHYQTGNDKDGVPYLSLCWAKNHDQIPLIAPLEDPSQIADQVLAWLGTIEYNLEIPDIDGDYKKGWKVNIEGATIQNNGYETETGNWADVFTVQPYFIIYGK